MAKNATHRVLLLRSGATDWDQAGRLQGSTDLPLSAAGRADLAATLQSLGRPPIGSVYCAGDEASVATAQLLAAAAGSRVVTMPELQEMDFGLWEGVLRSELDDRFCRAGRLWGEDPSCVTPPEGEAMDSFVDRLKKGVRRALSKAKGSGRRSVNATPAVGVVLRPVGDAVARCLLGGVPISELHTILKDRPGPVWLDVDISEDWVLPNPARHAASVSAA